MFGEFLKINRKKINITAALMVVLLMLVLPGVSKDASAAKTKKVSAGAIVSWKGEVSILRGASRNGSIVKGLVPVYVGDTIVTSDNSRAKILLRDDTVLSVGPDTRLKISKYALATKTNRRYSVLNIAKGTVRSLVGRVFSGKGSLFRIRTQTAVVGVKGTDFFVSNIGGETEVVSASGRVTVADPKGNGKVLVKPGHISIVKKGKLPTEPVRISKGKMQALKDSTSISITEMDDSGDNVCKKCHDAVYNSILKKKYYHPKAENNCIVCHIKDLKTQTRIPFEGKSAGGMVVLKNLDKNAPYVLNISGNDNKGSKVSAKPIKFIPSKIKNKLRDSGSSPTVSPLKITDVVQGTFFAVNLHFKTSSPTVALIDYGRNDKLGMKTPTTRHLKTEHNIVLKNLKPGKKYFFRAIVQDIHGNKALSEIYEVRVDNRVVSKVDKVLDPPVFESVSVAKVGNKHVLTWKANKTITPKITLSFGDTQENMQEKESHYPGFKTKIVTNTKICNECHVGKKHSRVNHPVGSVNWQNANSPRMDLPIGPGRTILCTTCHDAHGGNFRNMLRDAEQTLCADCHRSKQ